MLVQSLRKSCVLAQNLPIYTTFFNVHFEFVLPVIYININGQTKLEVFGTQIDHFILEKTTKIAIS